jgi:hypothetical protein
MHRPHDKVQISNRDSLLILLPQDRKCPVSVLALVGEVSCLDFPVVNANVVACTAAGEAVAELIFDRQFREGMLTFT